MKYVALLRGINIGGKNKVSMKQLALRLEQAGFFDVSTYINSGNVFFSDEGRSRTELQKAVETIITKEFGLTIKALVLDRTAIETVVSAIPSDWKNNTDRKCDVMFLWDKYKASEVISQLPAKPDIDTVIAVPGAIIWGVERNKITKSGMLKIVGTDLYAHMTIRNCNTVRKIDHLINA